MHDVKQLYIILNLQHIISLPGSNSLRSGLMFHCRCFFISTWDLRDGSDDRREILHGAQH